MKLVNSIKAPLKFFNICSKIEDINETDGIIVVYVEKSVFNNQP